MRGETMSYKRTKNRHAVRDRGEVHGHKTLMQSAMEYLMTYGWALLIVAIIMIALFQLGFFNNQPPKAAPGSCEVVRTTAGTNLEGLCKNLEPQSIPVFGSFESSRGNGKGNGEQSYPSYIQVPPLDMSTPTDGAPAGFTITAWVYWYGHLDTKCSGIFDSIPSPAGGIGLFAYGGNNGACDVLWINGAYVKWPSGVDSMPTNQWLFVVATYNQVTGAANVLLNNQLFSSGSIGSTTFTTSNDISIGADVWPSSSVYSFNGLITNVQVYDTPLSASAQTALYDEGIGGDLVDLQDLVAWWPLNGNAQDYSGYNGNGGTPSNIMYNGAYPVPPSP